MNAISQIEVVKHHRGSLLLEFVVVPDWWNVELIKHGWNVLAGGCIMMYPLKNHRSAVVEIRCDASFVQKVGFLEGRERCGAGVALYLPSTWEPMWSCWKIFFTTWQHGCWILCFSILQLATALLILRSLCLKEGHCDRPVFGAFWSWS